MELPSPSPRPWSEFQTSGGYILHPGVVADVPEAAVAIAACASYCSAIDAHLIDLVSVYLDDPGPTFSAISVHKGSMAEKALLASAKEALQPERYALLHAVMKIIEEVKIYRHDFCHGLWGRSEKLPGHLILAKPKTYNSIFSIAKRVYNSSKNGQVDEGLVEKIIDFGSTLLVYSIEDLNRAALRTREAHLTLQALMPCLDPELSDNFEHWKTQLLNRPLMQDR